MCPQDLDDIDTYDSSVINCLQDYSAEIKSSECKRQVKKYLVLASQDIRFDVTLAEACYEDRTKYCDHVPPVRRLVGTAGLPAAAGLRATAAATGEVASVVAMVAGAARVYCVRRARRA